MFLRGPCRDVISKLLGSSAREAVVTEPEESPLKEAVTRERLVKIQQAGKGLAGASG
jgi:hypothetical protein